MFFFTLDNYKHTEISNDPKLKEKYLELIEGLWDDFQPMRVWLTGTP
jgi:hypothetical protein